MSQFVRYDYDYCCDYLFKDCRNDDGVLCIQMAILSNVSSIQITYIASSSLNFCQADKIMEMISANAFVSKKIEQKQWLGAK